MGLVRFAPEGAVGRGGVHRMPPLPLAAAAGEIGIGAQGVPAGGEDFPLRQRLSGFQPRAHVVARHERETGVTDPCARQRDVFGLHARHRPVS